MATLPFPVIRPRHDHTVADLLTEYAKEYFPALAATTQYQQRRLFLWLARELGFMLLTDLTPAFLRQWRDSLSKRYAPGTVRRYLTALSSPLKAAVQVYGVLAANPFDKLKKPAEPAGRTRFLSDEERVTLLEACKVSRNPHLYTLVLLALSTGCRKNELRLLRWRDLDLERGAIRVNQSKNKEKRNVPLRGPVVEILRQRSLHQPPDGWVFARHDGREALFCDGAFTTAVRRAGLLDFHFHDLRHSAASYLAMSGASLREVAALLGHKKITSTMRYSHLSDSHTGAVVDRLIDRMFGDGSPQEEGRHGDV